MILGLPTATYTLIHVIISLIAIATGLIVLFGLLSDRLCLSRNPSYAGH